MDTLLCVGTSGLSVWFSRDQGVSWTRPLSECGLYLETRVWALAAHRDRPRQVWAGTDRGLQRWDEDAQRWTHLPSPMDGLCIWSLQFAPDDPDFILAGTQPAGIYRSRDGGRQWERLGANFPDLCMFVHIPRVTQILFDPLDPNTIWAGVEIDGIHVSHDRGDTWTKAVDNMVSEDIHGIAVVDRGGRTVYATTNKGMHVSTDEGRHWRFQTVPSDWQYGRAIVPRADDSGILFLANGNGPPGDNGRLLRSRDRGATWEDARLPGTLNSTVWCVATNPADPSLLFAATNLGQLFRSTDGGETWTRMTREFGEVRSLLWVPN